MLEDFRFLVLTPLASAFAGTKDAIQGLIDLINDLGGMDAILSGLLAALFPFLGRSPSPLEKGLRGINEQLQVLATSRLPSIAGMGGTMQSVPMFTPAMPAAMHATPAQAGPSVSVQFGDVTIANGMDMAVFEARVQRAVMSALQRG